MKRYASILTMRSTLIVCALFLSTSSQVFSQDYSEKIDQYITTHERAWGLLFEDWQDFSITDQYQSSHNGLTHIYLQQNYEGISVFQATMTLAVSKDGEVVYAANRFIPKLAQQIQVAASEISPQRALEAALEHLEIENRGAPPILERLGGANRAIWFQPGKVADRPIKLELMYYPNQSGQVYKVWKVNLSTLDKQNWWNVMVEVQSGEVVGKDNWVIHDVWGQRAAHKGMQHLTQVQRGTQQEIVQGATSPSASPFHVQGLDHLLQTQQDGSVYNVFPLGVESPNHGSRQLVSEPADPIASPYGWHDINGEPGAEFQSTRGNNTITQEDKNGNNGSGSRPDGGANLRFDFPLPSNAFPTDVLDASTTNLFYWTNLCHDLWYHYGFDEESGNFQQNNYDRGGVGGDPVFSDAQDGSSFNNANFGTPPDGESPRMQMFLWLSDPERGLLNIDSPANIAGNYQSTPASFGPSLTGAAPIKGTMALVQDSTNTPELGCTDLVNAAEINGKIALVQRGECFFDEKVKAAQDAGAIAVVIGNNRAGALISPGGDDPSINIPSIMISQNDYNLIIDNLAAGVQATLEFRESVNDIVGDFDNGVIAHEFGHGISTRLTGGPATNCLAGEEQMGEGWSDWVGLVMTVAEGQTGATRRGIGTFIQNQATSGRGIRPFPYSTDMDINPVTYGDIADGSRFSVPHGVGSVWAAMLWDLYWAFVDEYGYDPDLYRGTGGNNMAMQLVMDGMKLQPCAPGFVDGRDAILAADEVNYGGVNQCLIWEVFARRGLGFSARQGSSASRSDGTEAFDLPDGCQRVLKLSKTTVQANVPANGTVNYVFQTVNATRETLSNLVLVDTLAEGLTFITGSGECATLGAEGIVSFNIGDLAPGDTATCAFEARVDLDRFTSFLLEDDIEGNLRAWRLDNENNIGARSWTVNNLNANSGFFSWFAPNAASVSDQRLMTLRYELPANAQLSFWHDYETETSFDGGTVEISLSSDSTNWIDLGEYMIQNGYNGALANNNPAGGVSAFTGDSEGYIQTLIDLSSFAGERARIRFRMLSDNNTANRGWFVDDVSLLDRVSIENSATVSALDGTRASDQVSTLVLAPGPVSIDPLRDVYGISIYPNPVREHLFLSFAEVPPGEVRLSVSNLMGQTLRREQFRGAAQLQLSTQGLSRGVYFLSIEINGQRSVEKIQVD